MCYIVSLSISFMLDAMRVLFSIWVQYNTHVLHSLFINFLSGWMQWACCFQSLCKIKLIVSLSISFRLDAMGVLFSIFVQDKTVKEGIVAVRRRGEHVSVSQLKLKWCHSFLFKFDQSASNISLLNRIYGCFILASSVASILQSFSDVSKMQTLPIDCYQDAHTLEAKTQAVDVKSTQERLGSSHTRLTNHGSLKCWFTPESLYFLRQNLISWI